MTFHLTIHQPHLLWLGNLFLFLSSSTSLALSLSLYPFFAVIHFIEDVCFNYMESIKWLQAQRSQEIEKGQKNCFPYLICVRMKDLCI